MTFHNITVICSNKSSLVETYFKIKTIALTQNMW